MRCASSTWPQVAYRRRSLEERAALRRRRAPGMRRRRRAPWRRERIWAHVSRREDKREGSRGTPRARAVSRSSRTRSRASARVRLVGAAGRERRRGVGGGDLRLVMVVSCRWRGFWLRRRLFLLLLVLFFLQEVGSVRVVAVEEESRAYMPVSVVINAVTVVEKRHAGFRLF